MTRPPRRLCKYLSGPLRLMAYFRGLYTSSADERDGPGSMAARATAKLNGSSGNRVGRNGRQVCSDRGGSEPCATSSCTGRCWG
jgi:hypothetical protein